jgi:hypothetical protein
MEQFMTTFSNSIGTVRRNPAVLLLLLMALTGRAAPLPPGQTLYDVTFGGGTFVAVGANGTIFSSVNGGAWSLRTAVVTNDLRAVAFGGGLFVAAGANGTLASSPDGVAWTVRSVAAVLSSPDIAYGNGRFVVGGKGPAGFWTMLVSANGVNWESVSVEAPAPPSPVDGLPFGGVTFGAGKFLAVGGTYSASQTLVSTNGLTWQERGAYGASQAQVGPVTYGNGRFAMISEWYDDDDDDGGPRHNLITSDDGTTWNWTYAPVNYGQHAIVAADCATVVTWSYPYAPGFASLVWYSHDLLNWFQLQGITNSINALAFGNGTFVGVGNDIVPLNIVRPVETFTIQPATNFVGLGSYVNFQASTPCLDPPVRYQWRLNGANIPGASNLYYYVYTATADQAGAYTVVASNAIGSVTSVVATLTIDLPPPEAPTFISPVSDTTNTFLLGQTASLSVGVNGWPRPTFQWRFNGTDIPGATNSYLSFWNINTSAEGEYTVQARNGLGVVLSPKQILVVTSGRAPSYTPAEVSVIAVEGSRSAFPPYFSFGAGFPSENFSVLKNGINTGLPVTDYPSYFTLRQVGLSDSGRYTFIASNSYGVSTSLVVSLTVTPGSPLDHWTQRNPLPQNDALLKVAYLDGQFLAVGDRGAMVSSPNGTNWFLQRLQSEVNLTGVARDGSRFVAVGGRSVFTSQNGVGWFAAINRADLSLQAVAFANGRFVAVGGNSILTYTDALGWRDAVLPSFVPRQFRDVAFGNGRWVAVGASQGYFQPLWTSASGIDWAPVTGITADFESVIFANGQFLAVGDEGEIFTSPDGLAWTPRNSTVSSRLIAAAYGNGRYVVVGTRGRVLSSSTGVNWTKENSGTPDRLESVTFGNGLFVAVGENGTTLSSVNGATWFRRSQGSTRDLDGMVLGNGLIAVAGKGGNVLTSINGSNFVEQSTGVTNDLHGIGWGNGLYVGVGEPGAIITSPNGVQWTPRASGSVSSLKSVASGAGRWVAVGTQGEIVTSTDGTAWTPQFSPTANDLNSVAYGKGLFVVVGDNLPPNGTLLTSPDGLTWARRTQFIGKNLRSVTFANGMFLATANDGIILVSDDGLIWQQRFTGEYRNLRGATYASGIWALTSNEGFIFTSTNAVDWVRHDPQNVENLHSIVYLNGQFVTIGNRGIILQSDYFVPPALLAAFRLPGGVGLSLTGEPGMTYRVEAADELPATQWLNIGTFTLSQPTTNFLTTTSESPNRFYRAVSP